VLGGLDTGGQGLTLDKLAHAGASGDFAGPFRWVFVAAAVCLAISFVAIAAVEERPMRGPATPPVAESSVPAE
jgi:hypothetical protein